MRIDRWGEAASPMSNIKNKSRNHHPDLPLRDPSIFRGPPRPGVLLRWFARNRLYLRERVTLVLLALAAWAGFCPPPEDARQFQHGWIMRVWLVNLMLMPEISGGLRWYFFMRKGQRMWLKFGRRGTARHNRLFDLSDQVRDDMFWTLTSGVGQLTAFQVVILWSMANGYAPVLTFDASPVWFLLWPVLIPVWLAFHFFWVHRLPHHPVLCAQVRARHHRNVKIGRWSGLSMHPLEHLRYLSALCIHWLVPSRPIQMFFHVIYRGPGAAMICTGYANPLIRARRRLALATVYHQRQDRYFECSYGNQEMPGDCRFGTFHDGSKAATRATRARKTRIYS